MLIEVSDSSLRFDREKKAPLYAQHGIPEMWLIDVESKQVFCMRDPRDGAYQSMMAMCDGLLRPLLPGVAVDTGKVLSI